MRQIAKVYFSLLGRKWHSMRNSPYRSISKSATTANSNNNNSSNGKVSFKHFSDRPSRAKKISHEMTALNAKSFQIKGGSQCSIVINECEDLNSSIAINKNDEDDANYEPAASLSSRLIASGSNETATVEGGSTFTLNGGEITISNSTLLNQQAARGSQVETAANMMAGYQASILASLEYLINHSKSSNLNFNTKLAIANIGKLGIVERRD